MFKCSFCICSWGLILNVYIIKRVRRRHCRHRVKIKGAGGGGGGSGGLGQIILGPPKVGLFTIWIGLFQVESRRTGGGEAVL